MDDPTPSAFYPTIPEEDKKVIEAEKQKAAQSLPFLDGVSEWFEEQIKQFDSIEYALMKSAEYEQPLPETLIALNICRNVFSSKRGEFESLKLTFRK